MIDPFLDFAPRIVVIPIEEQHVDPFVGAFHGIGRVIVDEHVRAQFLAHL